MLSILITIFEMIFFFKKLKLKNVIRFISCNLWCAETSTWITYSYQTHTCVRYFKILYW